MTDECKYDEKIESYIEGGLSDEQKQEFEQHLIECDDCREQVEVAQRLETAMQRVATKMEKLHQRIEEKMHDLDEKITRKMEKVQERIEQKTGAIDERIAAKMEKLHEKMEARAARFEERSGGDTDSDDDMDEFGREMDAFGREMDEFGREMEEFGREMDEFGREMEAEAPKWLTHSVMQKVHADESAKTAPKHNWLLWLGSVLFGLGAVALCALVILSGVGNLIGDAIATASPQVQNGILGNQTLLLGLALLPFGYGLFRVGQAMGYL